MDKYIISIVGPTGIGKTSLSIKLATYFKTEIISADSRQFYKEIPIGTAAPSNEEQKAIIHHFIHNKSILDKYSVGDFEREAIECITTIHKHNPIVVLVGGSGLYVQAVLEGLDDFPEVSANIRTQLNTEFKTNGIQGLQKELKTLDPIAYEAIALDNPHRVIRALEICRGTGKAYSGFLNKEKKKRNFKTIQIGLTAERSLVYGRINRRVDLMIAKGLVDEVKSVLEYKHLNALNTVGYKEVFRYLEGHCSLDSATEEIKKNSRRFAKRQFTWFKRQDKTKWYDHRAPIEEILAYINKMLSCT
ncbi:tRNA (adenosine(37)-N6)-dimethylallyltransferase MiaA [Flavobacteriaceae bacterium]|nr:tRNA (adenosine(37)-N6)-dimethylallyltransferase MiaA [Flavobacteriaceae bacterium]